VGPVSVHADWLTPDWHLPEVGAVMTTRCGGASAAPFDSMNLRDAVGDDPAAVRANLARLEAAIGVRPEFLNQVHGSRVVRLRARDPITSMSVHEADACFTTDPGVACSVQVADCLPVLFAAPAGRAVGAAHAGWRGLSLGVLEATVRSVCEAAQCSPSELQAWMGPCIGPRHFEVGPDVLEAFGYGGSLSDSPASPPAMVLPFVAHRTGKWMANLPMLARDRLKAVGVHRVTGGQWCTVEAPSRFFSYRRDRITGRMAAVVWIHRRG